MSRSSQECQCQHNALLYQVHITNFGTVIMWLQFELLYWLSIRFIPVVVGSFGGWLKVVLEQIRSWGQHWRQKRVAALLLNRISWTRNWKVCSSDARDDLQWGFIKWWAKSNNFLCPLLQKKIQVNELVSIFDFLPFPKMVTSNLKFVLHWHDFMQGNQLEQKKSPWIQSRSSQMLV